MAIFGLVVWRPAACVLSPRSGPTACIVWWGSARKGPRDAGPAAAAARPPKRAVPAARSDAAGDRALAAALPQELDAAGTARLGGRAACLV